MSIFKQLKVDENVEQETNVVPSANRYGPLDSGVYDMVIDMAYADQSQGGAHNVNFVFKDATGREYKETIYVTNRKGENTYVNKTTGQKALLPGFNTVNAVCLLTVGEELSEIDTEEKMVKIWDYAQRKDVPQSRHVLMPLLGQKVTLGIIKQIEDKNVKNAQGNYVPSGETRETNQIDKVFRESDKLTVPEIRGGKTDASYYADWSEKNTGTVRNRSKGTADPSVAGGVSASAPAASTGKKLFG